MRVRRGVRVSAERTETTWFTLQELADLVHLAASRDIPPATRVRIFVDGQEIRRFTMEITHHRPVDE